MLVVMNQMTLMVADLIKPLFSHYRIIYLTFLLIFFFGFFWRHWKYSTFIGIIDHFSSFEKCHCTTLNNFFFFCHVETSSPWITGKLSKGYVTCKFSTRVEIHPRMNSTLPIVKALFVVTCWNESKFQPYSNFNPVSTRV